MSTLLRCSLPLASQDSRLSFADDDHLILTLLQLMAEYGSAEALNTYSPKFFSRLTFSLPPVVVTLTSAGGSTKYRKQAISARERALCQLTVCFLVSE